MAVSPLAAKRQLNAALRQGIQMEGEDYTFFDPGLSVNEMFNTQKPSITNPNVYYRFGWAKNGDTPQQRTICIPVASFQESLFTQTKLLGENGDFVPARIAATLITLLFLSEQKLLPETHLELMDYPGLRCKERMGIPPLHGHIEIQCVKQGFGINALGGDPKKGSGIAIMQKAT